MVEIEEMERDSWKLGRDPPQDIIDLNMERARGRDIEDPCTTS
jgi:hypothetical protein